MKLQRWHWYAAGAGIALGVGWIVWRKRAGESLAASAGRALGENAVDLVSGAVSGVLQGAKGAVIGAAESIAGVQDFVSETIPGRVLFQPDTNLLRLQGNLIEDDPGHWTVEVQNTSTKSLAGVKVELVIDKFGFDPVRYPVGTFDMPPQTGIRARGVVLLRKGQFGLFPTTARLYAKNYLVSSIGVKQS